MFSIKHLLVLGLLTIAACNPLSLKGRRAGDDDCTVDVLTRYPKERDHSPITAGVAANLRLIAATGAQQGRDPAVLMRVGDSITEGFSFLSCFNLPDHEEGDHLWDWRRNLAGRDDLRDTIDYFLKTAVPGPRTTYPGDAVPLVAEINSFDRESLAAHAGWSAAEAIAGDPSDLDQEIAAIDPMFAMIMFGANDVGGVGTFEQKVDEIVEDLLFIVDDCLARGIVPIVRSTPTQDTQERHEVLLTLDHMLRSIAQGRQIPFIDMHRRFMTLDDYGLRDGVHPNSRAYNTACHFDEESLAYGTENQNLLAIEALDRVHDILVNQVASLDEIPPAYQGAGTSEDPILVDSLDFIDFRRVEEQHSSVSYSLTLRASTDLRILVTDQDTTDVDIQLSDSDAVLQTADRNIEARLDAGSYTIRISAEEHPGTYQMVVMDRADDGTPD